MAFHAQLGAVRQCLTPSERMKKWQSLRSTNPTAVGSTQELRVVRGSPNTLQHSTPRQHKSAEILAPSAAPTQAICQESRSRDPHHKQGARSLLLT